MMPGYEALMRLQQGNRQFVANIGDTAPALSQTRRLALAEGQQPFAIWIKPNRSVPSSYAIP